MHSENNWYKDGWKIDSEAAVKIYNDKDVLYRSREGAVDMVNSPAHYTRGTQEAISIIEEAIQDADDPVVGMLHAQSLKYLLRIWLKGNAKQDAEKARWYLNRLISKL